MKSICLMLCLMSSALLVLNCAGTRESDPVYIECRGGCETSFSSCIKKGGRNEAKKAACEVVRNKCVSDCGKK